MRWEYRRPGRSDRNVPAYYAADVSVFRYYGGSDVVQRPNLPITAPLPSRFRRGPSASPRVLPARQSLSLALARTPRSPTPP